MTRIMNQQRQDMMRHVERFENRLKLARATELANSNRALEAESLLAPGGALPESSESLDLLARIHVKQGRFDQARKRWVEALKTGERREEFEECIRILNDYSQRVFRRRIWVWRMTLAMLIGTILLCIWILIHLDSHPA